MKLKVFAYESESGTRKIVAAAHKTDALKVLFRPFLGPKSTKDLKETKEPIAVKTALAEPGAVFWRPTLRPDGSHYVRSGEGYAEKLKPQGPEWRDDGSSARAINHGVKMSIVWIGRANGYLPEVAMAATSTHQGSVARDREPARRAAESLARRAIAAEIERLKAALEWLGPEPEATVGEGSESR